MAIKFRKLKVDIEEAGLLEGNVVVVDTNSKIGDKCLGILMPPKFAMAFDQNELEEITPEEIRAMANMQAEVLELHDDGTDWEEESTDDDAV